MAGPVPSGSMMGAPSGSSKPGSAMDPSAAAQEAAIRCGSAASQPSVQCAGMPARYRQRRKSRPRPLLVRKSSHGKRQTGGSAIGRTITVARRDTAGELRSGQRLR
jgi:hypothetical protein